jgi:hypothetical protein
LGTFTNVSRVPSRQPSGTTTGCTPRPLPALPPVLPLLLLLLLLPLLLLALASLLLLLLLVVVPLAAGLSFCCWCLRMLCSGTTTQLSCLQQQSKESPVTSGTTKQASASRSQGVSATWDE